MYIFEGYAVLETAAHFISSCVFAPRFTLFYPMSGERTKPLTNNNKITNNQKHGNQSIFNGWGDHPHALKMPYNILT